MPEGIEGSIGVVKTIKPEVAHEITSNFTPLKIQKTPTHSPKEQEILTKLASYNEQKPGSQDQSQKSENSHKVQLDELRHRAKDLAQIVKGQKLEDLPREIRDEISMLTFNGGRILEQYYENTIGTEDGKGLLRLYNPKLTDEEITIAHQAYVDYKAADKQTKGFRNDDPEAQERLKIYGPEIDRNKEILKQYGLTELTDTFNRGFKHDYFENLLAHEFSQLGLPLGQSLEKKVFFLPYLRKVKDVEFIHAFFGPKAIDEFDKSIYEQALVDLDNTEPLPRDARHWDKTKAQQAIEALKHYPTPEVITKLVERLYEKEYPNKKAILGTLATYHKPEVLIHIVFSLKQRELESNTSHLLNELHREGDWPKQVQGLLEQFPALERLKEDLMECKMQGDRYSTYNKPRLGKLERALTAYFRDTAIGTAKLTGNELVDKYIIENPEKIYKEDLVRNGILTEEESKGVDKVYGYTNSDVGKEHTEEIENCIGKFGTSTSSQEERMQAVERLRQMARISKLIEENPLIDESKYGRYQGDSLTKAKNVFRPLYSLLYKPEVTVDQAENVLKVYAYINQFSKYNEPFHYPSTLTTIQEKFGESEHFPFILKTIATFNRGDFVRYATPDMWRTIGKEDGLSIWPTLAPTNFIDKASKQDWREAFGDDVVERFLGALPKDTEERRNAFLHNEYDRTSEFVKFLFHPDSSKGRHLNQLTKQEIEIMTDYIGQFGLSKNLQFYYYFKQLSLFENGQLIELPEDIKKTGISSKKELFDTIDRMKELGYGEDPLMDVGALTSFELENLYLVTGKASHSFESGRPSFERIVSDFKRDVERGAIEPVPEGYKTEEITLRDTVIEFDSSAINSDFQQLSTEINFILRFENDWSVQTEDLKELLLRKIGKIDEARVTAQGNKKEYLDKEYARFESYTKSLENVDSVDSLMKAAAQMKMDKTEKSEMDSFLRKVVLRQLFSQNKQLANEFSEMLKPEWKGDQYETIITPEKILALVNLVKEPIHEHVLDMKGGWEQYWSPETREVMRTNKDNLRGVFEPYYSKLKGAVEDFEVKAKEEGVNVKAIPDRGFIGEMSGYLANVCYTAEYPLLKGREVVPYKFVTEDKDSHLPKFMGSVLVFEVETDDGEGALLIRGFDVPKEVDYDMERMIEGFIDKMVGVAKARGKKRVLVPGNHGAMSNYRRTIDHFENRYVKPNGRVTLSKRFSFNGYNLTDNSYIAREIPAEEMTGPSLPFSSSQMSQL